MPGAPEPVLSLSKDLDFQTWETTFFSKRTLAFFTINRPSPPDSPSRTSCNRGGEDSLEKNRITVMPPPREQPRRLPGLLTARFQESSS
jgi:hypothetical protein